MSHMGNSLGYPGVVFVPWVGTQPGPRVVQNYSNVFRLLLSPRSELGSSLLGPFRAWGSPLSA